MNKCIANCPSNTWPINGYCVYCNDDCEVCKSAKECAKCKTHYLFDNKCIENCPNGYYHATNPNRCEKCYDNCVVCNDNNRCQVCKEGYYLLAGFCIKDCPNGFFKNEYNKTCDKCKLECETCNSANICVECADGYSLLGTTCITDCPDSYVSINGVCTPCGNNCKNCLSSDVTICTNCLPVYVLKNGKCVVNCGDGYFANSLNICAPCGNNCMSCSNQDSCNLCYKPYFNYRGICISYCPDSFVGVGNECVMCDKPFDVDDFQRLQPGLDYNWLQADDTTGASKTDKTAHDVAGVHGEGDRGANGEAAGQDAVENVQIVAGQDQLLLRPPQERRRTRRPGDGHKCEYSPSFRKGICTLCFEPHNHCKLLNSSSSCQVCYQEAHDCPASESKAYFLVNKLAGLFEAQEERERDFVPTSGFSTQSSEWRRMKVIVFSQFRETLNVVGDRYDADMRIE